MEQRPGESNKVKMSSKQKETSTEHFVVSAASTFIESSEVKDSKKATKQCWQLSNAHLNLSPTAAAERTGNEIYNGMTYERMRDLHDEESIESNSISIELGECQNCEGQGPIGSYCLECEDTGMIYERIVTNEESIESSISIELGECQNCEGQGPIGRYCLECEDTGMIYERNVTNESNEKST